MYQLIAQIYINQSEVGWCKRQAFYLNSGKAAPASLANQLIMKKPSSLITAQQLLPLDTLKLFSYNTLPWVVKNSSFSVVS